MRHNHDHINDSGSQNIKIAFLLNFAFTILEIIGGIWTNSMAILSDALHDLGDSLSLGAAWYLEKKSTKNPDSKFTFGYARFSLLGAILNSLVLVGGSVVVLSRSIPRIFSPQHVRAEGMLAFAVLGIAVNLLAMLKVRKGSSINQKTVSWHLLEDVLGWAVVLVAGVILLFVDIPIIDPILSLGITIYVLINAVKNLRQIVDIFLERTPSQFSIEEIENEIKEKYDVLDAYHTHIWSLDGQKNLLSINVVVKDIKNNYDIIEIKRNIRDFLKTKNIIHSTIEIEFESEEAEHREF